jgi:hypothetical protein
MCQRSAWKDDGGGQLTYVAVWVTVFGEVSLSLLQNYGQSSRVVHVSIGGEWITKPGFVQGGEYEPVALELGPDIHRPGPPFLPVDDPVELVCEETSVERFNVESMRVRERGHGAGELSVRTDN